MRTLNQYLLSSIQLLFTLASISILEIGKSFTQPIPLQGELEYIDSEISILIWVLQWGILLPVGLLITILILTTYLEQFLTKYANIFDEIVALTIGICSILLFSYIYFFTRILENQKLLYLGYSPEMLIGTVVLSLILLFFPLYKVSRPYRH